MSEQIKLQGLMWKFYTLAMNAKECHWRSSRTYSEHQLYDQTFQYGINWMDRLVEVSAGYGIKLRMPRSALNNLLGDPRETLKDARKELEWVIDEIDIAGIKTVLEDIAAEAARQQYLLGLEQGR